MIALRQSLAFYNWCGQITDWLIPHRCCCKCFQSNICLQGLRDQPAGNVRRGTVREERQNASIDTSVIYADRCRFGGRRSLRPR